MAPSEAARAVLRGGDGKEAWRMAKIKAQSDIQPRKHVFIGGTGDLPIMRFVHSEPKPIGAESEITLVVETPTHRYTVHRMCLWEDYQAREKAGRFPRYAIKGIWDTTYDAKAGLCYGTPNSVPTINQMCVVVWGDKKRTAMPVEIEPLSNEEAMTHQQTLNREGGGEEYRNLLGAFKKIKNFVPVIMSFKDDLVESRKQQDELVAQFKSAQSQQTHPKKKKWENVWALYCQQSSDLHEVDKWREVAKKVVVQAREEGKKREQDRDSLYLTPAQLKRCIDKLNGGSEAPAIVKAMADSLRMTIGRHVPKEKREAARQAN
jgi:hypothetical protein